MQEVTEVGDILKSRKQLSSDVYSPRRTTYQTHQGKTIHTPLSTYRDNKPVKEDLGDVLEAMTPFTPMTTNSRGSKNLPSAGSPKKPKLGSLTPIMKSEIDQMLNTDTLYSQIVATRDATFDHLQKMP